MARPLNEKIAELPPARREKVEARGADLIAEEMSLRRTSARDGFEPQEVSERQIRNWIKDGLARIQKALENTHDE